MPDWLRLTLLRDSDGTAELFVEASASGFSGRASAWFSEEQIEEFGEQLAAFPIVAEHPPLLQGGFWAREGHSLEQCHVSLRVVPVDRRGTLAIQVRLETPLWQGDSPESQCRAALTVRTDYASLQEFSRAVVELAAGRRDEAVLESSVTA